MSDQASQLPSGDTLPAGAPASTEWLGRWRERADRTADRYQEMARTHPLLGLPLAAVARYAARQGMLLASAVAFRLFLWLLPLALLVAGILAAVAKNNSASLESASKTAGVAGAASQQVITALRDGDKSWWVAVVVGAVLFLWGTRTLTRNLTVVNAHAWAAPVPKQRQKDMLITTLALAFGCALVPVFAALVARLDRLVIGGVVLAVAVQSAATAWVWLMICLRLPDGRASRVDLMPGCLLVGIGLAIMSAVSRIYLPRAFAQSSQLYGTLGIASVILAWLLLIGQLIVGGAVLNSVWSDYRADQRGGPSSATPVVA